MSLLQSCDCGCMQFMFIDQEHLIDGYIRILHKTPDAIKV